MKSIYSHNLRLEIFGKSHDAEIGMSLSGIPAGFKIDIAKLQDFLARRAPGYACNAAPGYVFNATPGTACSAAPGSSSHVAPGPAVSSLAASGLTSSRREEDKAIFTSGLDGAGFTTGETITAVIKNNDINDADYDGLHYIPRPNHADYTTKIKYGLEVDTIGGGHSSGRMSAPLCVAGSICMQILESEGVSFNSKIDEIGGIEDEQKRINLVREIQADNNSVGGIISLEVDGLKAGIGSPMFYGMENLISEIMFAIPAVKGIEFGAGFSFAKMDGFSANDEFVIEDGSVVTTSNNCGGILGGITSGMPLTLRVAFKPTPSIGRLQRSVNLKTMEPVALRIEGRHDPCIVLRARPCVEAACAIAIMDAILGEEKASDSTNKDAIKVEIKETEVETSESEKSIEKIVDASENLSLASLRLEIDEIDDELVKLFERRMDMSKKIGNYKKEHKLPTTDEKREKEKLKMIKKASRKDLKKYSKDLYKEIFKLSKKYQR